MRGSDAQTGIFGKVLLHFNVTFGLSLSRLYANGTMDKVDSLS